MGLYSDPPPLHPFSRDKPTLLVCWWITAFCTVIISLRVVGRYIRTETLFREDKTAALALVPLLLRMGCAHVVLLWGTNNAQLEGVELTEEEVRKKEVASGLVLLSRVFLWILKCAILDFFRRLSNVTWRRSYDLALLYFRRFLIVTFIAIIISGLAECQPFSHYWQVLPDPGGQCRQGYAQLLTMATCNVITDLSLVLFPVPVIIRSSMSARRKARLVLLFSLSLGPVTVTLYRVPRIIADHGSQEVRSLYASVELLLATAAANALVLGSFVRNRGVKKRRYRYDSIAAASSVDPSVNGDLRRPSALRYWGSDEDLVRDLGLGLKPELREDQHLSPNSFIPAPTVATHPREVMARWQFPGSDRLTVPSPAGMSSDDLEAGGRSARSDSSATPRRVSFFDYGGLLTEPAAGTTSDDTPDTAAAAGTRRKGSAASTDSNTASPTTPGAVVAAGVSGFRRSSVALLQDLGGLLTSSSSVKSKLGRPRLGRANTSGSRRSAGGVSPVSPVSTVEKPKDDSLESPPVIEESQPLNQQRDQEQQEQQEKPAQEEQLQEKQQQQQQQQQDQQPPTPTNEKPAKP
ncbi:hypothetical protein VTJ49DRAFT_755 [Mycothermus thermophilus]|uniref:Rhodopsin domain-containing protein n=1 Tax=Humicola insolens TaxID=85995 RepID=A0ABR3VEH6_HUMIN